MSAPRYTPETANALLPQVSERAGKLRDAHAVITGHRATMASLAGGNGGTSAASGWIDAGREVSSQLSWFAEQGIVVRDIEQGLIDFPSERGGSEVFLCWRIGEERVAFWHDTGSGFAGRRPLDEEAG